MGGREEAAEAEALTHRQAGAAAARVSDPRPNWVPILCAPSLFLECQRASRVPPLISDPRYFQSSPSFQTIPGPPQSLQTLSLNILPSYSEAPISPLLLDISQEP